VDKDDPEAFVSIGYFTDTINVGETLGLTVEQAREGCEGENYEWIEANGVGSLDAETGLNVIYTAPETGNNCPGNAEIQLICGGEVVDTLIITINYNYAISFVYPDPETEIGQNDSLAINVEANGTPLTWEVSGTGFSLEHAETAGTGNVLQSDGSACGSAKITITDCNGNVAIGYVRCTVGQWVNIGTGCGLEGIEAAYLGGNQWQATQGKYRQTEVTTTLNIDSSNYCGRISVPSECATAGKLPFCLKIDYSVVNPACLKCGDQCYSSLPCDRGICTGGEHEACQDCGQSSDCEVGYCECQALWVCINTRSLEEWQC
jgi:hypothetical protein